MVVRRARGVERPFNLHLLLLDIALIEWDIGVATH